VKETIP